MQTFKEVNFLKGEIVKQLLKSGFQISPDALEFILSQKDPLNIVKKVIYELIKLSNPPLIVTKNELMKILDISRYSIVAPKRKKDKRIKIIKTFEKEKENHVQQKIDFIEKYRNYFVDRFFKIKRILLERTDANDTSDIEELKKSRDKSKEHKVIGIISEIKDVKGKGIIKIEDLTGELLVYIPKNNRKLRSTFSELLPDIVVMIKGKMYNGYMYASDIYFPDIPSNKTVNKTEEDISVVFISDIHVGSKHFLENSFLTFIDWLNGDPQTKYKDIAETVEYVIIAGDLVDGIGIYPNQEEDLIIDDIYKQYEKVAEYLNMIERDVSIIIIPGNHDAVRQAIPQPPIPKDIAPTLYENKQIKMFSNPTLINIEGTTILINHGRGLEDVAPLIPNASLADPDKAMTALLKVRHLAPVWGGKTQIAPYDKDNLVIDIVPDIVHMGHLHVTRAFTYRNVYLLNSGTFQSQTDYQRRIGFDPTPGEIPVINLRTYKTTILKFR